MSDEAAPRRATPGPRHLRLAVVLVAIASPPWDALPPRPTQVPDVWNKAIIRTTATSARAVSPQWEAWPLTLAGDNGPHAGGTNPYVTAIVHLAAEATPTEREDLHARTEALQKKYEFSWDGSLSQDRGPDSPSPRSDYFAIRISLHRSDLESLSREAGILRVEPISGNAF
jgi:hypothetical protein